MKTLPPSDAQYARCRSRGKFTVAQTGSERRFFVSRRIFADAAHTFDSLAAHAAPRILSAFVEQAIVVHTGIFTELESSPSQQSTGLVRSVRMAPQIIRRHEVLEGLSSLLASVSQGIKECGSWLAPCPKLQARYQLLPITSGMSAQMGCYPACFGSRR